MHLLSRKRGVILRLPGDEYLSSCTNLATQRALVSTFSRFMVVLKRPLYYDGVNIFLHTWIRMHSSQVCYCIPGNFSDVKTLANLVINSFSLKSQVAYQVLHCSTSTSIKVCTMKNEKSLK